MIQDIKNIMYGLSTSVCGSLVFYRLVHSDCDVLYIGSCYTKWLCLRFY